MEVQSEEALPGAEGADAPSAQSAEPPPLPLWQPPTLIVLDVTVTAGGVANDLESNGGIWTS